MDLGFQARGPKYKGKKKKKRYSYSIKKNINQDKYTKSLFLNALRCNHLLTTTKKCTLILFIKSINCCKKYIFFSHIKTYFCYFNIVFKMSHTIIFLIFGCSKYLAFRTPGARTLILG